MEQVSDELLIHVFQFLSVRDTGAVTSVCARWNGVWWDDALWHLFHERELGGRPLPPLRPNQWLVSFKFIVLSLKRTLPSLRLDVAIKHGAEVVVGKLIAKDPTPAALHSACRL